MPDDAGFSPFLRSQTGSESAPLPAVMAQTYAGYGWRVFPLHIPILTPAGVRCSCGELPGACSIGKHPRTPHGHCDATIDLEEIDAHWQRHPDANIGIATGARSGLVVIDVDPRHGGNVSLEALEAQYGPLPDTMRVRSGGDDRGWHLYFRYPGRSVPSGGRGGSRTSSDADVSVPVGDR